MNIVNVIALALCGMTAAYGTACGAELPAGRPTAEPPAVQIGVDPRVELIAIIFRLAGNPEYNRCEIPVYDAAINAHFKPVQEHAIVKLARSLRAKNGVSFDAPMGLAVRLPAIEEMKRGAPRVDADGLDGRWKADGLKEFLALLPTFIQESKFEEFLKQNEKLFQYTTQQAEGLMRLAHLEWFDQFFGKKSEARFHFVPGLANGPNCYGVRNAGAKDIYCVLGVWERALLSGMPSFKPSMISTVVHEFSHSYGNPIVDAHLKDLRPAGERLFPAVEAKMRQQAYTNWQIVMYESMVRAAEARYAAAFQGDAAVKATVEYNAGRGFTWIGGLADVLKQYEGRRDRYPTLDTFFPEVVKFFEAASRDVAQGGAKAPKVVKTVPAAGERDVDPGLQELTVVFDRDMSSGSWAWTGDPKLMPEIPNGAKPAWRDARTCVLPVRMQPGRSYTFGINGGQFTGFLGTDGTPAEAAVVTFSTRAAANQ